MAYRAKIQIISSKGVIKAGEVVPTALPVSEVKSLRDGGLVNVISPEDEDTEKKQAAAQKRKADEQAQEEAAAALEVAQDKSKPGW